MIQIAQIQAIMDTIEGTDYKAVSSPSLLMDYGFKLQQWMAFSGSQMAELKKALQDRRRQVSVNLVASLTANKAQMPSATFQKDYVNDLCAQENADYELAQRCNSACIHAMDLVRTCISLLKTELSMNT